MPVTTEPRMYLNGKIVDYADCKVHAFSSAVKYGAGVFEGLRGYWNDQAKQLYVFRLREHMERLRFGLKAMRYADIPPLAELERAIVEVSRANNIRATAHFRLIAFLDGDDELATVGPTGVVAGAVVRGSSPRIESGMTAMISSYTRIADNAMPPRVKCTANYVNNRAAELEARAAGYDGALMLTQEGKLSEASGACCFLVRNGKLITPDLASDILESITRETVIELARTTLGLTVEERRIDRSELVAADEMFACGSGWEVIPIVSVGRIDVGAGKPGPVTRAVQKAYFDVVHGRTNQHAGWLTPVW
ncbi:MAG: branched-chain-amino-acid transaminase [Alphaproteobacteria bacterium]|nr:branched-chain-amino-acid transaminase [Alphaproteobacteria bacterium]